MITPVHLIDGRSTPSTGTDTIDVLDPSDDRLIGRIPAGTASDADAAVAAARAAATGWARTSPGERAGMLKAAVRRLRDAAEELAELQHREGGKPLDDSRGGVDAGLSTLEQYAELGPLHRGRALQGEWGATDLMVHEPLGVAVALVPWNDPIAVACGLVGAALVTGNTVVLKPSERTPLSGHRLGEILAEELPAGVLGVALGDARVARPLVAHEDVDVVLHVGSVETGREVAEVCARQLKRAVLELGGKDPVIVDAGVDPRWAAEQLAVGSFANAGQICVAAERIYVHRDVADAVVDELVVAAKATEIGPLVDHRQRDLVHGHVVAAVEAGATLHCGGEVPEGPGSWYPPTVLSGVPDDTPLMVDETFGPVAALRVVDDFDEALRLAGASRYGLAAVVLTPDQEHAQRAWRELPVGTVKVNAAFGGAPGGAAQPGRGSGLGFGYGPELLDELTHTKVVHLAPAPAPR